ncbi:MAG TPA: hypothetical protein VI636_23135 [Candidatus Angelobacter sp.]
MIRKEMIGGSESGSSLEHCLPGRVGVAGNPIVAALSRLCRGKKAFCRDKDVLDFSITCAAQESFGAFFEIALFFVIVTFLVARCSP